MRKIILGDNAEVLPSLPAGFARLIYIDPPFNTGKVQKRERIRVAATDGEGDRGGFGGKRFNVEKVDSGAYAEREDAMLTFVATRSGDARRKKASPRVKPAQAA